MEPTTPKNHLAVLGTIIVIIIILGGYMLLKPQAAPAVQSTYTKTPTPPPITEDSLSAQLYSGATIDNSAEQSAIDAEFK